MKRGILHLLLSVVSPLLIILSILSPALAADDKALLESIKTKNNDNWNRVYGQLNYSYTSTTKIKAWLGNDTSHTVFTGGASGVVTFNHGKSSTNTTINLEASGVPSQVNDVANKAKEKRDRNIESFVFPPFMNNVLSAYRLKILSEERYRDYDCYILAFYPDTYKKGYMSGKVWIDKKTLMMVKYEGRPLIPPPFVTSGIVIQDFFYEEKRDIWLSQRLYITGTAQVLVFTINGYIDSAQTDYMFDII